MQSQNSPAPNDERPGTVSAEAWSRGHEAANPPASKIVLTGALVLGMVGLCLAVSWFTMGGRIRSGPNSRAADEPNLKQPVEMLLPNTSNAPPLDVAPAVRLAATFAREEQQLRSYGWVDRAAGLVHIPIDRSMDLIAQQGLPVRQTNQVPAGTKSSFQLLQERTK